MRPPQACAQSTNMLQPGKLRTMDRFQSSSGDSGGNSTSKALAILPETSRALQVSIEASQNSQSREMLNEQLRQLRIEIEILRSRIRAIGVQTNIVVRKNAEWIDASAHHQLGPYPWLKLSAASLLAFTAGRLLRRTSLGMAAMAIRPMLFALATSITTGSLREP